MAPRPRIHPAWLLLIATWVLIGAYFVRQRGAAPPVVPAPPPVAMASARSEPPRPTAELVASPGPRPVAITEPSKQQAPAPSTERADAVAPTAAATGPQLRLRLLEASERRPMPRVSVWLHPDSDPENRAAAVKGFTDGNGELVHQKLPPGGYKATAKIGPLPPVEVGRVIWRGDEKGERVQELLYEGLPTMRLEALTPDGKPSVGAHLFVGLDATPRGAVGEAMPRDKRGFSVELVTDAEGHASGPMPLKVPMEAWMWTGGELISFDRSKWSDALRLDQAVLATSGEVPIKVFVRQDTMVVTVRLLNAGPLAVGEKYLLVYGFGNKATRDWVSSEPRVFDRGVAQFSAPRGAAAMISIGAGTEGSFPPAQVERQFQLPGEGSSFEVVVDMAGNVKLIGKAVTPEGAPAPGIAFVVTAYTEQGGRQAQSQLRENSVTAADGSFEATLFSGARFELSLGPRRSALEAQPYYLREPLSLTQAQIEAGPVRVTVIPSGAIWGQVVGLDGKPATDAVVGLLTVPTFKRQENLARTDAEGFFTLDVPQLETGTRILLCAYAGGHCGFLPYEVSATDKAVVHLGAAASPKVAMPEGADGTDRFWVQFAVPGLDTLVTLNAENREVSGGSATQVDASATEWELRRVPLGVNATIGYGNQPLCRVLPDPVGTEPGSCVLVPIK